MSVGSIRVRRAADRGTSRAPWLESRHTFSFGDYHAPAHMGFRALRVLNDDTVAPGRGFGEHPHRDAEILTLVLEGRLEHRDSLGNGSILEAGDIQYMSAGHGVRHSEFNPSTIDGVRFLQVWLLPTTTGGAPRYEDRRASTIGASGGLTRIASARGVGGAITTLADAEVFLGRCNPGVTITHALAPGRGAWIHVVSGRLELPEARLDPGDGAAIEQAAGLSITGPDGAEFVLFDLA